MQISVAHHNRQNGSRISIIDPLTLEFLLMGEVKVSGKNYTANGLGFSKLCGAVPKSCIKLMSNFGENALWGIIL